MPLRVIILIISVVVLAVGCQPEPKPQVISYQPYEALEPADVSPPGSPDSSRPGNLPGGWIPQGQERDWTAIVIHHSATRNGNAAVFDRAHRARNWDGVGYNFVIGNGTDSGDGQIEVTFRWNEQRTGAHTGNTPDNWANREAIGICLVGDFNQTRPSERQMQSLARLVRFLQNRYDIPTSRIYGHGTTPGARATDCPGRNFSMQRLKSML